MAGAFEKVLIATEVLVFVAGLGGNVFIGVVFCAEWFKNKIISLLDFILACLALSRIGVICILLEDSVVRVFCPEMLETKPIINIIVDGFWNLSNSLGMWCALSIAVFYLLKVSNYTHPLFLWLKQRRDKVVQSILLGFFFSVLVQLLNTSLFTFWFSGYLQGDRNSSGERDLMKSQYFNHQLLLHLEMLIPLFLLLISMFLLIFSLWRHTKRMRHHARESGDLNTEVHVRAQNTVISFIFLLVVHYLDTVLIIWSYSAPENSINIILMETVALLYPSVHSFSLIRGNRMLKQGAVHLLRQIQSSLRSQ